MSKIFFSKRMPEPKQMEKLEMVAFEKLALQNFKHWTIPLVDHALETTNVKKGEILDMACGPGLLTLELAQRPNKFKISAVDISKNAIHLAKKNCKRFTNINFKIGSIKDLPYKNDTFDLVICKDSLHHFPNLLNSIKELLRVTKSGGYLYIQDMRRDVPRYLLKRSDPPKSIIQKLQYYSVRASYTKPEVKEKLKYLGVKSFRVFTRTTNKKLLALYNTLHISRKQLVESFQSRYVAIIKK